MYLVLPLPMRNSNGRILVETQAANGLDRWADHFDRIIVAMPVLPELRVPGMTGFVWKDATTLEHHSRIEFQPLPWAYTPVVFARAFLHTRRKLAENIARADYLQFAIGGLVGDWAAVAARQAMRLGRRYAIHTDRVEHEVLKRTATTRSPLQRWRAAVEAPLMARYHRHIIQGCALGLWHGEDCFRAYAPWCRHSHLIHDVHTKATDGIGEEELARKLAEVRSAPTLRVCYAGRLDPMKAPLEWLQAVATAKQAGAHIQAVWFGEGPLLTSAQAEGVRMNLAEIVSFPGFVAGRPELLAELRHAHALVFTHITPESPRILIEALVSGTPILGYANAYAANLIEQQGGGTLVPLHDVAGLGSLIAALAADRGKLAGLIAAAAHNGRRFNDAAVFAERSELIHRMA